MRQQSSTINQLQSNVTSFAWTSVAVLLALLMLGGCSPAPSPTAANVGPDQNTAAPELDDQTSDLAPSAPQATSSGASTEKVAETATGGLPRLLDLGVELEE